MTSVGSDVKGFAVGDHVGVGCMVGSCKIKGSPCRHCAKSYEQFCSGAVFTYNSKWSDGKIAYGGYSSKMVVDQQFCLTIPKNLPLDRAAPLLCAGITVWSPMKVRKAWLGGARAALGDEAAASACSEGR